MLLVIALLLAILALGGGFAVHPLLFLLLVLAAVSLLFHSRRGPATF